MKGVILNNRYQLNDIIGVGGMAYVYDAYDTVLSRNVAIKVLKDQFGDNDDFINKLKKEATSSASIVDDNIVSIFDVGTAEINGKMADYIVMEKINGRTLKDIIEKEAPLSEKRIIYYAKQVAKALQTAHIHGLVHRDIKPANILITNDDKVKVVDFGIAHVSTEATITYTSSILGTVHYISPEQAKGMRLDSRSDLYSLGVVLYELATAQVPFDGDSPVSIAIKHIQETPKPVIELNPNISKQLSTVISNLLEKEADNRYKTTSNLIIDLEKCENGKDVINFDKTVKLNSKDIEANSVRYTSEKLKKKNEYLNKSGSKMKKTIPLSIILLLGMIIIYLTNIKDELPKETELIKVPNVIELSEEKAVQEIKKSGLEVKVIRKEYDSQIKEGHVMNQSIKGNDSVIKGTLVELTISKGQEKVRVPSLIDLDFNGIEKYLNENGLALGTQSTEFSDKPKNKIIKQSILPGEMVFKGSKIDIFLSLGKKEELVIVPNVKGYEQSLALETIKKVGLNPSKITQEYNETVKENLVISQSIEPGTKVKKDSEISIVISLGKMENKIENQPGVHSSSDQREKRYVFNLTLPNNLAEKGVSVEIYNIVPIRSLVFRKIFKSSDALDGKVKVSVNALSNAEFEVYYDGKIVNVDYE